MPLFFDWWCGCRHVPGDGAGAGRHVGHGPGAAERDAGTQGTHHRVCGGGQVGLEHGLMRRGWK